MVHLNGVKVQQRIFEDFEILLDICILSKPHIQIKCLFCIFLQLNMTGPSSVWLWDARSGRAGWWLWFWDTQNTNPWDLPSPPGRSGSKGAFWTYDVFEALGWVSWRKLSWFFSRREMMIGTLIIGTLIGTVPSISQKKKRLNLTKSECGKIRCRYWYLLKIVTFWKWCVPFWVQFLDG